MNIITSKANNVVKKAKKLHQKKYRSESYLIEGWHLFEEALASQARILRIFALAEYKERLAEFSQTIFVSPEILSDLADSKTPQGIVAELAFDEQNIPEKLEGAYLFLEDVQDPSHSLPQPTRRYYWRDWAYQRKFPSQRQGLCCIC